MRCLATAAAVLAVLIAGACGGDDDAAQAPRAGDPGEERAPGGGSGEGTEPRSGEEDGGGGDRRGGGSAEERLIRNWIDALNEGRFDQAAGFFAPRAVIEQAGLETRLDGRDDAVRFNRSLPCRADVTDVDREGSDTLAAFSLRTGRTGACSEGGATRVRFTIRNGKFSEWRQLPPSDQTAPREIARSLPPGRLDQRSQLLAVGPQGRGSSRGPDGEAGAPRRVL